MRVRSRPPRGCAVSGARLFTLADSVGAGGANSPADVATIETLIDGLGA